LRFRFRALVELDPRSRLGPGRQYPSGSRALLINARPLDRSTGAKFFPATISRDDQRPLQAGDLATVTITVTDEAAAAYFAPGQEFTIWGSSTGHGIVSRRVFAESGPS